MNKIQYIKLLSLRGVDKLENETIAQAVKRTGGDPSLEEMVEVNRLSMLFYIDKTVTQEIEIEKLKKRNSKLEYDSDFLESLKACGVDNWSGYSDACDMMEE